MSASRIKTNVWVILLLVVCLCTVLQGSTALAETEPFIPPILLDGIGQAVFSFSAECKPLYWADQEGLFFIGGDGQDRLNYWKFGDPSIQLIQTVAQEPAFNQELRNLQLFQQSDCLVAFYYPHGTVSIFEDVAWHTVGKVKVSDPVVSDFAFDHVIGLVRDGESYWFLVRSKSDLERNALIHYSLSAEKWTVTTTNGVEQIAPYKPGQILVYVAGSIRTYSLGSQLLGESVVLADQPPAPFVYDAKSDRLFYMYQGDIYQKRSGQDKELVRVIDTTFAQHDEDSGCEDSVCEDSNWEDGPYFREKTPVETLLPLPNGQLMYGCQELCFVTNVDPIIGNVKELHIHGHASLLSNGLYMLTHPNVQIEQCFFESQSVEHPVDVFFTSTSRNLSRDIAEGKTQDLSKSAAISQRIASYLPQIQDAIMAGEKPMGLPTGLWFRTWQYDQAKWNEIGLPDPPRTVDELFDLITLWNEQYAKQYPDQELLGSGALFNYKSALLLTIIELYTYEYATEKEPLNFDTPEFRNLLERIIAAPDLPTDEWGALLKDREAFYRIERSIYDMDWNGGFPEFKNIFPLQLYGDRPVKIPADLEMLCISSSAPSPDLALEYLTFMAEFQTVYEPETTFVMTGGVEPLPVYPTHFSAFQAPAALGLGLSADGLTVLDSFFGTTISPATLAYYKQAAPYFFFPETFFYADDFVSDQAKPWEDDGLYYDKILSADAFIAMLNQEAKEVYETNK
ncbi:MAG: hypothetical protein GXY67_07480 [Clostridiales bacterium]|nr:hypothetical protein [Clostridiales bacterium]